MALELMNLRPSEIYFSQDSIDNYFRHHERKMIGETLDDICEGRITIGDLPKIEVAKHEEKWVTNDNRRLWVLKQLERLGKCETVTVWIVSSVWQVKLTTKNGGESIVVRGDPGGRWHLKATQN